jgi:hypothetical protein
MEAVMPVQIRNVPSESHEGTHYTVTYIRGYWACTCPDFFYREHKPECKHIVSIKRAS